MLPREILQTCIAAPMEAGTQIYGAFRPLDACRQDVWRKRVNRENIRQAIFGGDAPGLSIADACIVDRRVERTEFVDLIGDATRLSNARQIADNDCLRSGHGGPRFLSALFVPSVKDYPVSLLDQQLSRHPAKAV